MHPTAGTARRIVMRRVALICAVVIVIPACTAAPATPVPSPTPGPTAAAPAPQFPNPGSTGVPAGLQLVLHPGDLEVRTRGQVVDGMRVEGDIRVIAEDVLIKNTQIGGRVVNQDGRGHWRFTIEDSTIGRPGMCYDTGEAAVGVDRYTARGVRVMGFPDAFRVSGDDVRIEGSFVTLCGQADSHADGIQGYGGGLGVTIVHNTIDARVTDGENAAIFFADGSRQAEIRDNLLLGGGFSLRLHDESPNKQPQDIASYVVTGNRIAADDFGYGAASVDDCDRRRAIEWSDNVLVTVAPDYSIESAGAPVTC